MGAAWALSKSYDVTLFEAAPRLGVWAHRKGDRPYTRGLNSNGETVVELSGLGPGTFFVNAMPIMGQSPPTRVAWDIEVDGEAGTVEERTLDLR